MNATNASPLDSMFDSMFRPQRGFDSEAERARERSRELTIKDRAERLYTAARASDDAVHDAIYSGFFDIPNAKLADLFRAGDTAELGRVIAAAADKILRDEARDEAKREARS
ncbi:MAG: hypothetical protein ACTHMO_03915 [Rhodanobacteraceae bacterium]